MKQFGQSIPVPAAAVLYGLISLVGPVALLHGTNVEGAVILMTEPDESRPVIALHLNGKGPFRFFVDTGAGGNVISASLAKRLDLNSVGRQLVFNPTSRRPIKAELVRVVTTEIGALSMADQLFLATDLTQLGDNDGVFSVRSFPPGLLTFDFASERIRLEDGTLSGGDPDVMAYEPQPVVSLTGVVDGRELSFHLDTGSPDGITLPGALARDLSFEVEPMTTRESGPLVVKTGRLNGNIRIGHLLLKNPEVHVVDLFPDFGNIGMGFLQNKVLTIDRKRGLVRITGPVEE